MALLSGACSLVCACARVRALRRVCMCGTFPRSYSASSPAAAWTNTARFRRVANLPFK